MKEQKRLTKVLVFFLVLTFAIGGFSIPAAAENRQMTMQSLYVNVWPEYQNDMVEAGYYGTFVNDTGNTFDGEIRYNIPKGAVINMVCETEQGMVCQPYVIENAGEYDQVVWEPSHPIEPGDTFPVMIEYYYNPVGTQPQRQFRFEYSNPFNVENMTVAIKKPFRSSDFTVDPEAELRKQDGEGFESYEFSYNDFQSGEALSYNIAYVKNDNEPSIQQEQQQQTSSNGGSIATTKLDTTAVVIIVAFLAVLAVIIFIAMNNNNNSGKSRKAPAARSGKQTKQKPPKAKKQAGANAAGTSKQNTDKDQRKKLRKMLLDGKISEQTYQQLIAEIEEDA